MANFKSISDLTEPARAICTAMSDAQQNAPKRVRGVTLLRVAQFCADKGRDNYMLPDDLENYKSWCELHGVSESTCSEDWVLFRDTLSPLLGCAFTRDDTAVSATGTAPAMPATSLAVHLYCPACGETYIPPASELAKDAVRLHTHREECPVKNHPEMCDCLDVFPCPCRCGVRPEIRVMEGYRIYARYQCVEGLKEDSRDWSLLLAHWEAKTWNTAPVLNLDVTRGGFEFFDTCGHRRDVRAETWLGHWPDPMTKAPPSLMYIGGCPTCARKNRPRWPVKVRDGQVYTLHRLVGEWLAKINSNVDTYGPRMVAHHGVQKPFFIKPFPGTR